MASSSHEGTRVKRVISRPRKSCQNRKTCASLPRQQRRWRQTHRGKEGWAV